VFLENLADDAGAVPPLDCVARLCAYVSQRYLREIRETSHSTAEYVIFGFSEATKRFEAYHVGGRINDDGMFQHSVHEVAVLDDDVVIIGTDRDALRARIDQLRREKNPRYDQIEPRIALQERIASNVSPAVGGTLQFGIANVREFRIFATTFNPHHQHRGGAMQYLGFILSTEIEPIIGAYIKMTGLI
jgi:hypothetical protein